MPLLQFRWTQGARRREWFDLPGLLRARRHPHIRPATLTRPVPRSQYIKLQQEETKRAQRTRKHSKAPGLSPQTSRTPSNDPPTTSPVKSPHRANTAPTDSRDDTVGLGFDFPPTRTASTSSRVPDSSRSYLGPPSASLVPPGALPPPSTPLTSGGSFSREPQTASPESMRRAGRSLHGSETEEPTRTESLGLGGRRRIGTRDPSPRGDGGLPVKGMRRLNVGGGGGGLGQESEDDEEQENEVADDRDRPTTGSSASASGRGSRSESSHEVGSDSSALAGRREAGAPSAQLVSHAAAYPHDTRARQRPPRLESRSSSSQHPLPALSPLAPGYRSASAASTPAGSAFSSPVLQGVSGGSIMMRRAVSGEGGSGKGKGDSAGASVVEAGVEGAGDRPRERTRKDSNASHLSTASKIGRALGLGRKG